MAAGKGIQIIVGAEFNGKDLDRAEAKIRSLRAQTDKSAVGMKAFGNEMKRSFSTGSIIAAAAVTAFAAKSVKAFAEVQDAQSALSSTFGATGDNLVKWANETAIGFNLSRREALQAAQTMAVFGDSAGLAGQDLEQFSVTLTERAADAASFFGGTTQDAITAFGAALRGENEPIRKYGVLLDDATLRAKAFEMGLVESTKNALTPQQKTLAAYNVIMEQTTRVQGDVERTSDSMANQIKKAQAEFDNLQVAVGETVSVAIAPLLQSLNTALGFFNGLPGPIKTTTVAIVAIGAAALILVPKILAVRTAFLQMQTAAVASGKRSSVALMGIGRGAGIAATGLMAAAAAGQMWAASNENGQAFTMDNAFATRDYSEALREIIQPGWFGSLQNGLAGVSDALVPHNTYLDDAKAKVGELDANMAKMVGSGQNEQAAALFDQQAAAAAQYGVSVEELKALFPQYAAALAGSTEATRVAGEEAATAAPKIDVFAGAQRRAKQASKGLSGALDNVTAALGRQQAFQDYKAAMDEYVKNPTQETAAAAIAAMTDYADSLDNPKKKAKFVSDSIGDIKKTAGDANLKLKPYLEESLTRAERKAKDVTTAIDLIPTSKIIDIYYREHSRQIPDPTGGTRGSAYGGFVGGYGGSRADDVPAMLSSGEFVIQAPAVAKFGRGLFASLNQGVNPLAGMTPTVAGAGGSGVTINGGITVQSAAGERAETSLPRALRRMAFLAGMNG